MKRNLRYGNIELLRFAFCLCVLLFHTKFSFFRMGGGYLGVEFFFMVTGVFLAASCSKKATDTEYSLKTATSEARKNVFGRIKSIYPYLIPSTLIGVAVKTIVLDLSLFETMGNIVRLPADFLFLQSFGITTASGTGVVWYLSAMFIAIWILYPLFVMHYDVYVKYVAPILSLMIIGFLTNTYGKLGLANEYVFGWLSTGLLRGIAMISLGAVCYELAISLRAYLTKTNERMGGVQDCHCCS